MYNVLIIDDEEQVTDVIQRALTRFGYDVKTASGGKEGLSLFENIHFDLVITDIIMPFINGHAVAQHIRKSARSDTPIIGISGTPWLLNDNEFDTILSKPFTLQNLSDAVDSALCRDFEKQCSYA